MRLKLINEKISKAKSQDTIDRLKAEGHSICSLYREQCQMYSHIIRRTKATEGKHTANTLKLERSIVAMEEEIKQFKQL